MEEIEIRDAIRRHVTAGEPPLGLTAEGLLGVGRQRQRWRLGMGVSSGAAAAAVLVAGSLTLTPFGSGPQLGGVGCSLPLARGWTPAPSSEPTFLPPTGDLPSGWPASPSLDPIPGSASANPTGRVVVPTDGPDPSFRPTDGPSVPPTDGPDPSFRPTDEPSVPPTDGPVRSFWPTQPGASSTDSPSAPPQAKMIAAQCYLAKRLPELVPGARFAGGAAPRPFEFYGGSGHYASNGVIVADDGTSEMVFLLFDGAEPPPDVDYGWTRQTIAGHLVRTLRDGDGFQVEVYLPHTKIWWLTTGRMISEREVATMLAVPELDISG